MDKHEINNDIKGDLEKVLIKENSVVKDFTLIDDQGYNWILSDNLDKKLVLYFYPKDSTPGCTTQACSFRDNYHIFEELNVNVVGVSADSVERHQKFKEKNNLPFTLLSDEDYEIIKYFNAYGEKNVFGKKVVGILRTTFIIDENRKILKVDRKSVV